MADKVVCKYVSTPHDRTDRCDVPVLVPPRLDPTDRDQKVQDYIRDLKNVAKRPSTYTAATLRNLLNESADLLNALLIDVKGWEQEHA